MTNPLHHSSWVVCLCAQWCGTCKGYQALFNAMQAQFVHAHWHWVDIEDMADVVDPDDMLDLDNFPTLLVAHKGHPTFFGPLTPQAETLHRLLQAKLADQAPPLPDPEAAALLQRLHTHFDNNNKARQ